MATVSVRCFSDVDIGPVTVVSVGYVGLTHFLFVCFFFFLWHGGAPALAEVLALALKDAQLTVLWLSEAFF